MRILYVAQKKDTNTHTHNNINHTNKNETVTRCETLKVYVIIVMFVCRLILFRANKRLYILHWFAFQFHVQTVVIGWDDMSQHKHTHANIYTSNINVSNDWLKINYKTYLEWMAANGICYLKRTKFPPIHWCLCENHNFRSQNIEMKRTNAPNNSACHNKDYVASIVCSGSFGGADENKSIVVMS